MSNEDPAAEREPEGVREPEEVRQPGDVQQPERALAATETGTARLRALLAVRPFGLVASDALRAASDLSQRTDVLLRETVAEARRHGASWNDVGGALGISRQAAFQRFADPARAERGGTTRAGSTPIEVETEAAVVFGEWATRDWVTLTARFTPAMLDAVPEEVLASVWSEVTDAVGAYAGPGEPTVRRNGALRIVELELHFDDGTMLGRVSFDRSGRVSGLLVLDPTLTGERP